MKESIKGNRQVNSKHAQVNQVGYYNKGNNKLIRLLKIKPKQTKNLKNQESQLSRHLPLLGTATSQTILHDSVGFE